MFGSKSTIDLEKRIDLLQDMVFAMSPLLRTAHVRSHILQGCVAALLGEIAGRMQQPDFEMQQMLRRLKLTMAELNFGDDGDETDREVENAFGVIEELAAGYLSQS